MNYETPLTYLDLQRVVEDANAKLCERIVTAPPICITLEREKKNSSTARQPTSTGWRTQQAAGRVDLDLGARCCPAERRDLSRVTSRPWYCQCEVNRLHVQQAHRGTGKPVWDISPGGCNT